jgi:hypothetical protein
MGLCRIMGLKKTIGWITIKKLLLSFLLLIFFLLFAYWVKIQAGIDLFNSFSVGSHFPFTLLTDRKVLSPKKGILFYDNFECMSLLKKWSDSGLVKSTEVSREISKYGTNNTRCLVIRNSQNSTWVYSKKQLIEAKMGDVFYYEGIVNIQGEKIFTYMSIAAFDKNEKIINWNLFLKKVNQIGIWTKVNNSIIITDDRIKFITFRLVGVGSGEFWFDNILFSKIKESANH